MATIRLPVWGDVLLLMYLYRMTSGVVTGSPNGYGKYTTLCPRLSPQPPTTPHPTDKQQDTDGEKFRHLTAKSFLLETVRFYPSNHFLSYWKHFATIRHFFSEHAADKNPKLFVSS